MRQKILVFISILILNCFSVQAEEASLPELPALPSANITESGDVSSGDQLSFFEKIKNFFGLGEKEQAVESTDILVDPYAETEDDNESTDTPSITPKEDIVEKSFFEKVKGFLGIGGEDSDSVSDPYAETKEQEINSGDKPVSIPEASSATSPKEESLFEKAKNLLGFASDEKDESTASIAAPIESESSDNPAIPTIDDLQIPDLPTGNSDEGPSVQSPMTVNNAGEEEIHLPGLDDMKDDSSPEETSAATDEIPAVSETDESKKLELPFGFDDMKDDSSPEAPAITEAKMEEVDKLELPSGFDDMKDDSSSEPPETSVKTTEEDPVVPEMDESKKLELPPGFDDINDDSATEAPSTPLKPVDAMLDSSVNELAIPSLDGADKENMDISDAEEASNDSPQIPELSLPEASNANSVSKLELPSSSNSGLAVPSYIAEADANRTPKSNVSKYTKELKSKQTAKSIDKISSEELNAGNNNIEKYTEVTSASLDESQLKFVNNEAQVLILPNDDIVLGELTKEAKFDSIDFRSYVKIFWKKYDKVKREPQRRVIDKFINDYDENFNKEEHLYYEDEAIIGLNEAFKAIDRENIYSLISLLNSYPILQLTGDGNNTLLHEASYIGNYPAARLLVLKGIDVFVKNTDNQTALNVAEKFNNQHITFLLKSSGLK